jgi:hypothetical protein
MSAATWEHANLPCVTFSDRLSPDVTRELLGAFDLGPSRTLQQDVEFGVLQIVDIALKAISPGHERPDYRHQLCRSTEPRSDSPRLARAKGPVSLRPARLAAYFGRKISSRK